MTLRHWLISSSDISARSIASSASVLPDSQARTAGDDRPGQCPRLTSTVMRRAYALPLHWLGTLAPLDVQRPSSERVEDALMGLARQRPVARFAERRPWPSRCCREEVVESGAGQDQQSVCGPSAGHGEPPEGGVELVELGSS